MNPNDKSSVFILFLVFLLSAGVYGLYGFNEYISYDSATTIYSGQRMAEGVPHYLSTIDNRGPIAPILAGFGAIFAKNFSIDSVLSIRAVFFLFSCLTVVSIFSFTRFLAQSNIAGFVGSLTFLSFQDFAFYAGSGPQIKSPMVLFETLCLFFTARNMWFWAGLNGSLAFLIWQPCGIFPAAAVAIAAFQPRDKRFSSVSKAVFGAFIPVLLICIYYIYYKALPDLIDGMLLFNLLYLVRPAFNIFSHIKQPADVLIIAYRVSLIQILIGLGMIFQLYFYRKQNNKSWIKTLFSDPFSAVFLTYPIPFIWSFLDFQGAPDFYIFLPYVCLGFGIFINYAVQKIYSNYNGGSLLTRYLAVMVLSIALLIIPVTTSLEYKNKDLVLQENAVIEMKKRFGDNFKLLSISGPELLVLMDVPNPNRYISLKFGFAHYIDRKYEGGFDGFISEIQEYNPDVIAVDSIKDAYSDRLIGWIESNYTKEVIGPFKVYVSNDILRSR
ncbi:hypothetical protein C4544_04825 [candidate division WS5 bacterium]|uniref:Glycosyltransferase RgtA/B/C/D-like domain-containing protein n=1 Tax=candidate division WS5 bacterium TaxID=2093353 RepID=A0A419DC43_9BACT|nr:MAG: hypothetical protein C4544_04825 [candidate division WS5 bacterium]